jgi:mono/diheme cytochrome c family protein
MTGAIASVLALGLAAPSAPAQPSIRFEQLTHDFGTVPSDAKQTFAWPYRNVGAATLEITSTHPSCGCTASVAVPATVQPGEAGTLTVTYDPAGQSGDVRKTVTVMTNDPEHPGTILTILAKVIAHDEPVVPGQHPRVTGQSLLMGSCGTCHAEPAEGKSGLALWAAICAACHGADATGGSARGLRAQDYLAGHDDQALAQAIAYGTASPKMPGYSKLMGGPLDDAQIDSIVRLLRQWGPSQSAPAAARAPLPR